MKTDSGQLTDILLAALTALTFPAQYKGQSNPFSGQQVFGVVKTFDLEDAGMAFAELFVVTQRAAFVVLSHEEQRATYHGSVQSTFYKDLFSVLASDRSYKNRQLAFTGDSTTPGVLMIKDAILNGCVGEITAGHVCEADGGEIFAMKGQERDEQFGRIGWRQVLRLHGGREDRSLSRQAIANYAP